MEPPPYAAPEDLVRIRSIWPQIADELDTGFSRVMLKDAIPEYRADGNDATLYLRVANLGFNTARNRDERVRNIESVIAKKIGKQVKVQLLGVDDKRDRLYKVTESNVDNILTDKIAMPVEVTDEEE